MEPGSTPRPLIQKKKKTWSDSLPIDRLLSAVSVLVVAQSSSEIPEGLQNNPVLCGQKGSFVLKLTVCVITSRNENIWHPCDYILDGGYSDYGLLGCDAVWIGTATDVSKQHICQTTRLYFVLYNSLSLRIVHCVTFLMNRYCSFVTMTNTGLGDRGSITDSCRFFCLHYEVQASSKFILL